jgi:hypothetical protein
MAHATQVQRDQENNAQKKWAERNNNQNEEWQLFKYMGSESQHDG